MVYENLNNITKAIEKILLIIIKFTIIKDNSIKKLPQNFYKSLTKMIMHNMYRIYVKKY